MVVARGPDWLGSPQHLVAGIVIGVVVVAACRRLGIGSHLAVVLAIGVASTAEIVVELVEWPLRYAGKVNSTAYYDTLADLANTLVGAIVGALVGVYFVYGRRRRST